MNGLLEQLLHKIAETDDGPGGELAIAWENGDEDTITHLSHVDSYYQDDVFQAAFNAYCLLNDEGDSDQAALSLEILMELEAKLPELITTELANALSAKYDELVGDEGW